MEDTREKKVQEVDSEREALIAEMLRDAKTVEIPTESTKEPVIHRGDETQPAPMIAMQPTSAGYVYLWDSRTYEKIPVLYYMLGQKLRQRRPDGSYQFTVNDPGKLPRRGTVKCLLHPDGENRKHYDELGFRVCKKDNITNRWQLHQHMMKKHHAEWEAIREEQEEQERKEDRTLQRLILQQAGKQTAQTAEQEFQEVNEKTSFVCDACGRRFTYRKNYKNHIKTCK